MGTQRDNSLENKTRLFDKSERCHTPASIAFQKAVVGRQVT